MTIETIAESKPSYGELGKTVIKARRDSQGQEWLEKYITFDDGQTCMKQSPKLVPGAAETAIESINSQIDAGEL